MRHVDIKKVKIPEEWLLKAIALQKEIEKITSLKKKLEHIEKNPIWQDKTLFIALNDLMDGKCWYSEAKDLMSDRDIDHYRPKKAAKNIDGKIREGYWFLAYDWENYRFSSVYSNRLRKDKFSSSDISNGKGIYFPLKNGSAIATNKKQIDNESPYLLDPTKKHDAALISFNGFGKVIPSVPKTHKWDVLRVEASIKFYHLDHGPLKRARANKWRACQIKIDKIKELCSDPDMTQKDENTVEFIKNELIEWANEKEILSGVVLACLNKNNMLKILSI